MVNETLVNATIELLNESNVLINNATSHKPAMLTILGNPALVIFIFGVLLTAVIVLFVVKSVMPVSSFIYANARIQARNNYGISKELLLSLSQSKSLKEFKSLLAETIYGENVEKANDGLRSIHVGLEKSFINSLTELAGLSPKKSRKLIDAYLMFFEARVLKIIYRAKLMDAPIGKDATYSIGKVDERLLSYLLETKSIPDINVVMSATSYKGVFDKKYKGVEEFEVVIDQFVFNNFIDTMNKTKMHDGKFIAEILNKKVDISNILALLKFRIREVEREKQKGLLVDSKTELCSRFDKIINSGTLKEFTECFKGLPYYDALKKGFENYGKDGSLAHFENELYRNFKKSVLEDELGHTLGPYPLFSYLIKKEIELRNLFVISKGIDAGFSTEKIMELVV